MSKFSFENLEVYQKALDFIENIIDVCKKLPPEVRYTIGSNLVRAAVSIANNIAEGSGRRGKGEKKQSFGISRGSCFECVSMITVLLKKKYISQIEFDEIYGQCFGISQMLTKLIKSITKNGEKQ